jgi:AraC-like DNA-binding protein
LVNNLVEGIGFPVFFSIFYFFICKKKVCLSLIAVHIILFLFNIINFSNIVLVQEEQKINLINLLSTKGDSFIWNFEYIKDSFLLELLKYSPGLFSLISSSCFLFLYKKEIEAEFDNKQVSIFLLLFLMVDVIFVFDLNIGTEIHGKYPLMNILLFITILSLIMYSFFIPNFLYPDKDLMLISLQQKTEGDIEASNQPLTSYVQKKKTSLIDKIDDYFLEFKPFLSSDFNLKIIEKDLAISKKYISLEIKKKYNCGFNEYVNLKRLEYFKNEYLTNNNLNDKSLADIAFELGFGSISSFYYYFKLFLGCTPKEFLERYETEVSF